MRRAHRGVLTLRKFLLALVAAGVAYVAVIALAITVQFKPPSQSLQQRLSTALSAQDAIGTRLDPLDESANAIHSLIIDWPHARDTTRATALRRLSETIRRTLDSAASLHYALAFHDVPSEMRVVLARAADEEASLGFALLNSVAELQLDRRDSAMARLRDAATRRNRSQELLRQAQRVALADMIAREQQLASDVEFMGRAVFAWLALGASLLPLLAWFVARRIHVPLRLLEEGLERVTRGDLEASLPVLRDDEIGRLTGQFNNMTSLLRQRADEERRRTENLTDRLGRLLEESDNQILVIDAGSFRITQASRGATQALGYSLDQLQQLDLEDLLPPNDSAGFARLLAGAQMEHSHAATLDVRLRQKDGRTYPATVSVQLSHAEQPPVFLVVARDISERLEAERLREALRVFSLTSGRVLASGDLEAAMRQITAAAAAALHARRASVWHVGPEHLTCMSQYDGSTGSHGSAPDIPAAECPAYLEALHADRVIAATDAGNDPRTSRVISNGTTAALEAPVRHNGIVAGALRVEQTGGPRRWTHDEQSFAASMADFAAIALEGSERRSLETRLAQSQRMEAVGKLAGGIAHDFNNLLAAISVFTELGAADLPADDPHREDLAQVLQAVARGERLTRQLLAFSRQQVLKPEVLDPNGVVTSVATILRRLIGEDIQLDLRLDPGAGSVMADAGQLEQVLMNLAVNARDAMPEGGTLTVATTSTALDAHEARLLGLTQAGSYVRITVSDTGTGMTEDVRARAFDPFFTTKGAKGTGLGLATVYGIVAQSGGHIGVETVLGQGTRFSIHLPAVAGPVAPETAREEPPWETAPARGETILLAEDDAAVRAATGATLARQGYTVIEARSGEEALRKAAEHTGPIHVLLSDVVMSGISGPELARRLRSSDPTLRVLLMSGYAGDAIARRGVLESGLPLLDKPFTTETLARRVRDVLDAPDAPARPVEIGAA